MSPDWHSFNLLVERVGEPEGWDPNALGRFLAPVLKLDMIKKARILASISSHFGISKTMSSHSSWSLRRIGRLAGDVEEKQADYLARYCCMAAASGALSRLYWGPLIGQREGLIDDGTNEYPARPHVAFYGRSRGRVASYRRRPAFAAFQAVRRLLSGTSCVSRRATGQELQIHEYQSADRIVHAVWTTDGRRALLSDCYDDDTLGSACALTRDGASLAQLPRLATESPLYLFWPKTRMPAIKETARALPGLTFSRVHPESLTVSPDSPAVATFTVSNHPALDSRNWTLLRNGRNRVWVGEVEGVPHTVVFKQFGKKNRSRALRSWNTANRADPAGNPDTRTAGVFSGKRLFIDILVRLSPF